MEHDVDILILSEARVTHTRRWAEALRQRGLRVAVLSFNPSPAMEGINTLQFQVPPLSFRNFAGWTGRYRKALKNILSQLRPRIVHIHFLEDWRLDRDLLGETPLLISAWGSDVMIAPQDEPTDKRRRKIDLLNLADKVTATAPCLAQATASYGGLNINKIGVICFGVDTERFRPAETSVQQPGPVVGFVKHLQYIYGPDVLLQAFRQVLDRHSGACLRMIGKGPMENELKELAGRLNLGTSVEWIGAVPHAQVPEALQGMDVFVMPSRREAFGVSALEAQACGVPVVATDLPGIREAVVPGQSALLVPGDNPEALGGAILQLLDAPEQRKQMGLTGRRFVEESFRWSTCVDKMMSVYESLWQ